MDPQPVHAPSRCRRLEWGPSYLSIALWAAALHSTCRVSRWQMSTPLPHVSSVHAPGSRSGPTPGPGALTSATPTCGAQQWTQAGGHSVRSRVDDFPADIGQRLDDGEQPIGELLGVGWLQID